MLKKIILISIVFTLHILLPAFFVRKVISHETSSTEKIISIAPGENYKTSFLPKKNKVSYIEILFKNPGLKNNENFLVYINNIEYKLNSFNTGDPSWLRLETNLVLQKDEKLNVHIKNLDKNTKNIQIMSNEKSEASIKTITKLSLKDSFTEAIYHKIEWLKQTNKYYLTFYILLILTLCFI